jgi:hypothetical protein
MKFLSFSSNELQLNNAPVATRQALQSQLFKSTSIATQQALQLQHDKHFKCNSSSTSLAILDI